MPTLYVVAGPNGAGKTTMFDYVVPKDIDYLNADAIAKTIRENSKGRNVQDIANAEASKIFFEKVNKRESFSLETNLVDVQTYKTFFSLREFTYTISIVFVCVQDVNVCIDRVRQRVKQGGHNVNPDVVKARYETGLQLLAHYKNEIDVLTLVDTTLGMFSAQAQLKKGKVIFQTPKLSPWAKQILEYKIPETTERPMTREQAREMYKKK